MCGPLHFSFPENLVELSSMVSYIHIIVYILLTSLYFVVYYFILFSFLSNFRSFFLPCYYYWSVIQFPRLDSMCLFPYSNYPICYDVTLSLVISISRVALFLTPLVKYEHFIPLPSSFSIDLWLITSYVNSQFHLQGPSASTRKEKKIAITQASKIMHHAVQKLTPYWNHILISSPYASIPFLCFAGTEIQKLLIDNQF